MSKQITERQPSRVFPRFGNDFEHVFDDWFRYPARMTRTEDGSVTPPIDITEKTDRFVVTAELPGVPKDAIDVSVNDGVLTINAELKSESESKDDNDRVIRRERRVGKYVRSISLGTDVQEDKVTAKFNDGVLELELPKTEEKTPKRVAIDVN